MSRRTLSKVTIMFLLLSAWPLLAQVRRQQVRTRPDPRAHEEPCWKQAGIPKSAIEEREAIQRETRSQVEAVCADNALTPQQKRQRIREIRQEARQRAEALISPQQQEALQSCQKERAANHPPAPGLHKGGGGTGPCGELLPPAKP
jgi:hypothetical protein